MARTEHYCNAECMCAGSPVEDCTCRCGGENHGKARLSWLLGEDYMDDIKENLPAPKKGYIVGHYSSRRVWIDGTELHPGKSQQAHNHSPDGFAWGYSGSGPAQLALAIMLHFTPGQAVRLYQDFKRDFIAGAEHNFEIPIPLIVAWIQAKLEADNGRGTD